MTEELKACVLRGAGVVLRPMIGDDVPVLTAVGLDPALWQSTALKVRTAAEMREYVESALAAAATGTCLPFVLVNPRRDEIVGSSRFHSYSRQHGRIEIGFTWVVRQWQRTAVNTEAKYLMLCHAFDQLRCQRVQFMSAWDNAASRKALERIGAVFEGRLRSYLRTPAAGLRDAAIYSIVAGDWAAVRHSLESRLGQLHEWDPDQ